MYQIEYDESWGDEAPYWTRADEVPNPDAKLLKSGKFPKGTRWVDNIIPFQRREKAQAVVDAIHKTWPSEKYRVAELILR